MGLNGYVKLHRKLIEWGWYSDCVVKDVFLHILMVARFDDGQYLGRELKAGQAVIGRRAMAKDLGFSEQQIRTALKKLESTGEITLFSTNRFTIATVENWGFYQCDYESSNQQITNNQPTDNQQITNNQPHLKNDKNDKNNIHSANELFEKVWKLYPRKKGKSQISDTTKKKLLKVGEEALVKAIERYKKEVEGKEEQYILNGSTFFNGRYQDYLDENYEETDERKVKSFDESLGGRKVIGLDED